MACKSEFSGERPEQTEGDRIMKKNSESEDALNNLPENPTLQQVAFAHARNKDRRNENGRSDRVDAMLDEMNEKNR
jgi:hypothetical protein